ncbi:MAG: SUMF1/EgtB/PvdO family nonheme iron enzyme [Lewinellaceae bacterium]|nr:SUMF1/EgtB/PvdO family nonheme iron enzyme [Saprospiraceae bacterium]MCB9338741.1 SUMF1/EgtB/PvdO family nonheme iron enzyme [Lewinellaceae bacterium]
MSTMQKALACFAASLSIFVFSQTALAQATCTDTIPGGKATFQMVLIPGGTFSMGGTGGHPQRQVKLDSFWMGMHEVGYDEFIVFYQKEYDTDATSHPEQRYSADAVTRPTPQYIDYTYGMGKSGFPAVSMTQQAALRYCKWLYEKTGNFYRLPTEAEWEFVCRAGGSPQSAVDSPQLADVAWYYQNSFEKYHELGRKAPNAWGLYDMLGNAAEWTLDFYDENYLENLGSGVAENPWVQPTKRHSRTVRGGSYDSNSTECSCTFRQKSSPRWQARDPQIPKSKWWNPDSPFVGFRIVKSTKKMSREEVEAFFEKAIVD